jgi:hypothetical protein
MHDLLLAAAELKDMTYTDILYALPLIGAVSMVYSATRHEQPGPILAHALRLGLWVTGVMAVPFALLLFLSWRL